MRYFKQPETGEIYAFQDDASDDAFIPDGLVPIAETDLAALIPQSAPKTPSVVSKAQGVMALYYSGDLDRVEAEVAASSREVQLAWATVSELHKSSPMVQGLASKIGLDLDTLFSDAGKIKL